MIAMNLLKDITVEPIGFLFMFSILGEYTVVEDLIFVKFCLNNSENTSMSECIGDKNEIKNLTTIETESSEQLLYYNSILSLSAIIFSLISGSYGDTNGRIIPLMIPSICSLFTQMIFIFCSFDINSNIFPFIMICALISGISGGTSSLFANSFGFISDITTLKSRTRRIVALEAALFCGGFFGYSIIGLIVKNLFHHKYLICFSLFLTIHSIIIIYITFRLRHYPNTALMSGRTEFKVKQIPKLFINAFLTLFKQRDFGRRKLILLIITCFILISNWITIQTTILYLFVRNRPLLWDTSTYAYFNAVKFGITGLALCLLPAIQIKFLPNISDAIISMIGIISRIFGLVLIGLSKNTTLMFLSLALLTFSEYPLPAIRSILSKLIENDEKGKVFACLASLQNISSLIGGLIFPLIYKYQVNHHYFTGLGFEIVAVLHFFALIIFFYVRKKVKSIQDLEIETLMNSDSEGISILDEDQYGNQSENTDITTDPENQ